MGYVSQRLYDNPEAFFAWMLAEGRMYNVNGGVASTPVTFAGAYDADAPDMFIHVPSSTGIIPYHIRVVFEAVGTESTMEVIALASTLGDASATITGGAADTPANMLVGSSATSAVTASHGVDAGGITDPHGGTDHEFWRYMRPLTDTVATGENDRNPLVFTWTAFKDGAPPIIQDGGSLSVYAASQAGTGFITVQYAEFLSKDF